MKITRKQLRKLIRESLQDIPYLNQWLSSLGDQARQLGITDFHVVASHPDHPLGGGSYHYGGHDDNSPVKRIRKTMIDWETEKGYDPFHDWRKS